MKRTSQAPRPSKALNKKSLSLIAERFRVLGDPIRLQLLNTLGSEEYSVGMLVERVGATQANVSKHLRILLRAGLVDRRKEGLQVYYRVTDPSIFELCDTVCGSLSEQLAEDLEAIRGIQQV
jgi:DNA-binding transcriptional ArsR family regulator